MTAYRHARLKLTPDSSGSSIELEGQKLTGVRRLDLNAGVLEPPRLVLELVMATIEIEGEMKVELPQKTRDTLIALGWTPPGGEA